MVYFIFPSHNLENRFYNRFTAIVYHSILAAMAPPMH